MCATQTNSYEDHVRNRLGPLSIVATTVGLAAVCALAAVAFNQNRQAEIARGNELDARRQADQTRVETEKARVETEKARVEAENARAAETLAKEEAEKQRQEAQKLAARRQVFRFCVP